MRAGRQEEIHPCADRGREVQHGGEGDLLRGSRLQQRAAGGIGRIRKDGDRRVTALAVRPNRGGGAANRIEGNPDAEVMAGPAVRIRLDRDFEGTIGFSTAVVRGGAGHPSDAHREGAAARRGADDRPILP